MAAEEIICTVCGAKNPEEIERCRSCGARLAAFERELTAEEEHARRHQQEGFEWKWVFISFGIYAVLQGFFLVALNLAIEAYDPQGLPGVMISVGLWFIGGIVVGFLSPGKTFVEPAVGAVIAAIPTMAYIMAISDVRSMPFYTYIFSAVLGVMVALFGAFLGEKIQMGTRGHAKT